MSADFYCDQVLSGRTPVDVAAETDRVLAFYHTRPTWDLHIVIIPKEHLRALTDVEDTTLLGEVLAVVQGLITHLRLNESGYKLIANGGTYQSTQHLHFHLVSGAPVDPGNPAQHGELQV